MGLAGGVTDAIRVESATVALSLRRGWSPEEAHHHPALTRRRQKHLPGRRIPMGPKPARLESEQEEGATMLAMNEALSGR